MTTDIQPHALNHRLKMRAAISLTSRLALHDRFARACQVVARVDVHTDRELEELLLEAADYWEFDAADMTVLRCLNRDDVRLEIGVNGLAPDDVWRIIADTEKKVPF